MNFKYLGASLLAFGCALPLIAGLGASGGGDGEVPSAVEIADGLERALTLAKEQEYVVEMRRKRGEDELRETVAVERHFPRQRYSWSTVIVNGANGEAIPAVVTTTVLPTLQIRKTDFEGAAYVHPVPEAVDMYFLLAPGEGRPFDPMLLAVNGVWGGRPLAEVIRAVAHESPQNLRITQVAGPAEEPRRVLLEFLGGDAKSLRTQYTFEQSGDCWLLKSQRSVDASGESVMSVELEYPKTGILPVSGTYSQRLLDSLTQAISFTCTPTPEAGWLFTDKTPISLSDARLREKDHIYWEGAASVFTGRILLEPSGVYFFCDGDIVTQKEYLSRAAKQ